MKLFKKALITTALIFGVSSQAYAVDGYKTLTFGMSKQEVKAANVCGFTNSSDIAKGVTSLDCSNLNFSNAERNAAAVFVDGKFERFVIEINTDQIIPLVTALRKKYGNPTQKSSSRKTWEKIDNTPGIEAYLWFDNNTVLLQVSNDEVMNKTTLLVYTSRDYDNKVANAQSGSFSSDI